MGKFFGNFDLFQGGSDPSPHLPGGGLTDPPPGVQTLQNRDHAIDPGGAFHFFLKKTSHPLPPPPQAVFTVKTGEGPPAEGQSHLNSGSPGDRFSVRVPDI